ncbi:unnamed protein product [Effrenium voratum]|nr:unnamed protein product [Effrenium voratum]
MSMKRPASQSPSSSKRRSESPLRVACLGDSNTCGGGLGKQGAYPAQLQRELDEQAGSSQYLVKSFGVSGAVAANTPGKKCFVHQQRYQDALAFNANIFVVMLGTNDAWHRGGEPEKVGESVATLLGDLRVKAAASSKPHPICVLALPPGVKAGLRQNLEQHVHPALRKLAHTADTVLVDAEWTLDSFRPDKVHLSMSGAKTLAVAIASAICS